MLKSTFRISMARSVSWGGRRSGGLSSGAAPSVSSSVLVSRSTPCSSANSCWRTSARRAVSKKSRRRSKNWMSCGKQLWRYGPTRSASLTTRRASAASTCAAGLLSTRLHRHLRDSSTTSASKGSGSDSEAAMPA